jgi:hypothetical protein
MLIPGIGLGSPRQDVEIARGVILPTLARDELFAYLCVHAATSAWFRLKWLADLAALLAGAGEAEIRRLYERSQALGAGRSAGASLLLCHGLLGTPVPPGLLRTLRRDPSVALLVHAARKSMTGRAGRDRDIAAAPRHFVDAPGAAAAAQGLALQVARGAPAAWACALALSGDAA